MMTVSRSYLRDMSVCFFLLPHNGRTLTRVTYYGNQPAAETINLPRRAATELRRQPDLLTAAKALFESLMHERRVYLAKAVRTES
ncbi:hypothetical protein LH460_09305 [Laribacter hongkongensis]|uniref:hypothetical protein n=1 Tax=Laribacter hongkongensis TaxID=168471 RepID=UPI001EFD833E|nr:hypothetical protein [Laribacter hongkongensis]MCG9124868.1 hypothetical protein [Laribacter hongkongensis]